MITKFRVYMLSVEFYREVQGLKIPTHLKTQIQRAASGISLCIAEGYGRQSFQDKNRFYSMALGSLRESQAVLHLADVRAPKTLDLADHLGASLFKLTRWKP